MGGNIDYRALRTAQNALGRPVAAQATPATITVGIDGSPWVFKNGKAWLKDQFGDYHEMYGELVEGQMQAGYDSVGYSYDDIP